MGDFTQRWSSRHRARHVPRGRGHAGERRRGRFAEVTYAAPIVDPAAGDFDGDGNLDLVSSLSWGVTILYGDGNGRLGVRRNVLPLAGIPSVADLNGDGRDDIVALRREPSAIFAMYGPIATTATPSPRRFCVLPLDTGPCSADIDGDGATDIAVVDGVRVRVHLNDGAGGLVTSDALLGPPSFHFADRRLQSRRSARSGTRRRKRIRRLVRTRRRDVPLSAHETAAGRAADRLRGSRRRRNGRVRRSCAAHACTSASKKCRSASTTFRHPDFGGPGITGDHPVAAGDVLGAAGKEIVAVSGTAIRTFSRDATQQWREIASWDAGIGGTMLTTANVYEADAVEEIAAVVPSDISGMTPQARPVSLSGPPR